jgi:hypothetical protein
MFERFRRNNDETMPEAQQVLPAEQVRSEHDRIRLLIGLARNFDATVRVELGAEVADRYAAEQREVASKSSRDVPPRIKGMRF